MIFHHDPLGIVTFVAVEVLLLQGDLTCVYYVIEYGSEPSSRLKAFKAMLIHILYIFAVVSHLRAAFSDPGYVAQSRVKLDFSSDLEQKERKKRKKEPPSMDQWSLCTKCETYRPPRSHHCRICGRCVRRMDHHCPWINNCVGELNYKYFYLFISYTDVLCMYVFGLVVYDWVQNWHNDQGMLDRGLTILLFFETVAFGLFVGGMVTAQTLSILCNRSAIELRRYGRPVGFPETPKLALVSAVCGRAIKPILGNLIDKIWLCNYKQYLTIDQPLWPKIFWLFPCIKSRIPEPVPPPDKFHHEFV